MRENEEKREKEHGKESENEGKRKCVCERGAEDERAR